MTVEEQRDTLQEVIEMMDECARLLRSLHNKRIEAYCLADLEGRARGWLGWFARDCIEEELRAIDADA